MRRGPWPGRRRGRGGAAARTGRGRGGAWPQGLDDDEVRGGAGAAGLPGTVATRPGCRRGGGREDDLAEPGRRGQASGRGGRRGRGAGTRGTGAARARKDEDDGTRGRGSGRGGGEDEPRAAAALHVDLKK